MSKGNLTIYFNEYNVKGYCWSKAYDFAVKKDGEIVNYEVRLADDVNEFKAIIERYYYEFDLEFKQRSEMEMKAISQKHQEYLRKIGVAEIFDDETEQVEIKPDPVPQVCQNAFIFNGGRK